MFQFLNLVILVHFNHSLSKTVFVLHTGLKRKELFCHFFCLARFCFSYCYLEFVGLKCKLNLSKCNQPAVLCEETCTLSTATNPAKNIIVSLGNSAHR